MILAESNQLLEFPVMIKRLRAHCLNGAKSLDFVLSRAIKKASVSITQCSYCAPTETPAQVFSCEFASFSKTLIWIDTIY